MIAAGAAPDRVVVEIEIDTQRNKVTATASGATALVEAAAGDACSASERVAIAAQSFACSAVELRAIELTAELSGYERRRDLRVIDERGVVRLALRDYRLIRTKAAGLESQVRDAVETATQFGDVGRALPALYLLRGARIAAYEGLTSTDQAVALAAEEVEGCAPDEPIVILIEPRAPKRRFLRLSIYRWLKNREPLGLLQRDGALVPAVSEVENQPDNQPNQEPEPDDGEETERDRVADL